MSQPQSQSQTTLTDKWTTHDNPTGTGTSTDPTTFPDDLNDDDLKHAIKQYSKHVINSEFPDVFDSVTINDIDSFEISHDMQRAAGKVAYRERRAGASDITLRIARGAYDKWGWSDQLRGVIRHELIHVLQVVERGDGDHGARFKQLARKVDTTTHCEKFSEYNYLLYCSECGDKVAGRYQKSKLVTNPEDARARSGCCGAVLDSEAV